LLAAVSFGDHDHAAAVALEEIDVAIHATSCGGAEAAAGHAGWGFGGAGIIDGMGFKVIRQRLTSVEPFFDGDLVLVGGEVAHLWASRGAQPPAGCATTVLQFKPDWAARTGLPELAGATPLLLRASVGLEIRGGTRLKVQGLILRMRQTTAARRVAAMVDLLATPQGIIRYEERRIETAHTHGTGCTLASAVAAGLAQGMPLRAAVERARRYVRAAIQSAPGFGGGHGPLDHGVTLDPARVATGRG
jgi:hypothetical protein